MDILHFLKSDHRLLRLEILDIKKHLHLQEVRDLIKVFVSHYELHERCEESLFIELKKLQPNRPLQDFLDSYQNDHDAMRSFLKEIVSALSARDLSALRMVFWNFLLFSESHMRCEEKSLFPVLQKLVDAGTLERLGEQAELRYGRYLFPNGGAAPRAPFSPKDGVKKI